MKMGILRTIEAMRAYRSSLDDSSAESLGFVPTMGGLHAGHKSLIDACRANNSVVCVSIYVNSAQFAAGEDYGRYPVTLEADLAMCESCGVDVVFLPKESCMYPSELVRTVTGEPCRNEGRSEGSSRPTFFRGVATVVCKLLSVVQPSDLYIGQKDAQQCAVITLLCGELWPLTSVHIVATVRESDGLALSTRNLYLTKPQRDFAPHIYKALQRSMRDFRRGERDASRLTRGIRDYLNAAQGRPEEFELIYVSICGKVDILELDYSIQVPEPRERRVLICVAAKMGDSRLIDNVELQL